jgi:hypothetical protein
LKLFQNTEKERNLLNLFYEASITLVLTPDKNTIKNEKYGLIPLKNKSEKILN